MVPDQGSSIFELDCFISPSNPPLLQLLKPYDMESPDGLLTVQPCISHDILDVLCHVLTEVSFSADMTTREPLMKRGTLS